MSGREAGLPLLRVTSATAAGVLSPKPNRREQATGQTRAIPVSAIIQGRAILDDPRGAHSTTGQTEGGRGESAGGGLGIANAGLLRLWRFLACPRLDEGDFLPVAVAFGVVYAPCEAAGLPD